jgi:hypothetical protein
VTAILLILIGSFIICTFFRALETPTPKFKDRGFELGSHSPKGAAFSTAN